MSNHFVGSFYFKRTTSGNLLGEFSNNGDANLHVESARLVGSTTDFIGNYISSWDDGTISSANLKISPFGNKYQVVWSHKTGSTIDYEGEAFVAGEMLIGYYRKK